MLVLGKGKEDDQSTYFDFDGTMIDSEWMFYEYSSLFTEAYLLEQFGYKIPFADYQQGVGTAAELSFMKDKSSGWETSGC